MIVYVEGYEAQKINYLNVSMKKHATVLHLGKRVVQYFITLRKESTYLLSAILVAFFQGRKKLLDLDITTQQNLSR